MKNTLIVLASISALTIHSADAAKHGPRGGKGHPHKAKTALVGDPAEFGALKDKFNAHKRLTAGGAEYYGKDETRLRVEHAELYQHIHRACLEDRLSEQAARDAIQELLTIGKLHTTNGSSPAETAAKINTLKKQVRSDMADKVPADTLTPKLNRMQFHIEEALRFGEDTEALSSGNISSLRRKLDSLEDKEAKAKDDGSVSDRERENLIEESREIWRDALKDFG